MKIYTSYISKENLEELIRLNYLPMFIIRNMRDSKLLGPYSDTCLHLRELSPSTELLQEFKGGMIDREEYRRRYLLEIIDRRLSISDLMTKFRTLDSIVSSSGIVLLGYSKDPKFCHREFLAEFLESLTGYTIEEWKKN